MSRSVLAPLLAVALSAGSGGVAAAQSAATPPPTPRFFDRETPLVATLAADLGRLRADTADRAPWRPATLALADAGGAATALRVRTRGVSRLRRCGFPPLRLDVPREAGHAGALAGLDEPKLVSVCQDDDRGEQWLRQELQLYRIYALLTPVGHRARLLRLTYADAAAGGRPLMTRDAFLFDEAAALAGRVGGTLVAETGVTADLLDADAAALMAVFQYLIGNTDWSVAALHNIELVRVGDRLHPVPYDFDLAGAVDAAYALPSSQLPIRRVRDRLFRGACLSPEAYARAFALFAARREAIVALYHDEIGRRLAPRAVEETLRYFDEFYRTIADPQAAQRAITGACVPGE